MYHGLFFIIRGEKLKHVLIGERYILKTEETFGLQNHVGRNILETYVILLTNVTPINFKNKENRKNTLKDFFALKFFQSFW